MIVHIGGEELIRATDIVVILDCAMLESEIMSEFIKKQAKSIITIADHDVKSIVVTNKKIYMSPLSSATLRKRTQTYSILDSIEEY
ncbi:extracellular matrix regulator RemB [Bacillus sp. HMF5848]|uniref:extracellular matrix regulator RemB n=1 Tax=Bacillus sp. HMF5848 TaxID=2495421 RepID=UPI001639F588|nr:extracellular matrix/biofilm biosynthesis regulator RemA family protein [Bacillus sp. HMF5848]